MEKTNKKDLEQLQNVQKKTNKTKKKISGFGMKFHNQNTDLPFFSIFNYSV